MSKQPDLIKLKIIGKNTSTTIDGILLKNVLEREDKDKLKDYIEKYNKKPSEFWKNKIKKILTPKSIAINKEKVSKKVKDIRNKAMDDIKKKFEELSQLNLYLKTNNEKLQQKIKELEEQTKKVEPVSNYGRAYNGEY